MIEVGPCPRRLPSTAIALFSYGGVVPATSMCWGRDITHAARMNAKLEVTMDLIRAGQPVQYDGIVWPVTNVATGQDALIGRARSRVATEFLKHRKHAVLVMLDHDITWQGASDGYEGDIAHLARLAAEHQAIVGAIISKKVRGEGVASMIDSRNGINITIGKPGLIDSPNVGSGMTAYPRVVLQAIFDKLGGEIPPGFCPMFMESVVDHPLHPQERLHVSEDWIVCNMANRLGYKSYLATRPVTGHVGEYCYTVLGDAYPADMVEIDKDTAELPPPQPARISLLHATRCRPQAAQDAHDIWSARASGAHPIEYIYSVDDDDTETSAWGLYGGAVVRGASRGNVDAYNRAAYASSGDILIQVHDDVEPPQDWDRLIAAKLDISKPQVLHVDDGLPDSVNKNPHLLPVMVCTRAWAQKLGGLWFPDYVSVFCDNDAGEKAYAEGCVVDGKDIVLRHHWQGAHRDETQIRSYSPDNWRVGKELFEQRRAAGFPDAPDRWGGGAARAESPGWQSINVASDSCGALLDALNIPFRE